MRSGETPASKQHTVWIPECEIAPMPRFYFDIHHDDSAARDTEGADLVDRFDAGRAAIAKLRGVGGSGPPTDDLRRNFAIYVRNEQEEPVLKVALNFAFQWLDT
jgi:hypothetical protein